MMDELPIVTQADIKASVSVLRHLNLKGVVNTVEDAEKIRTTFARHRIASNTEAADLISELAEALRGVLARERERAKLSGYTDCTCINFSRAADREYENGICPHQIARAALAKATQ